MNKMFAVLAAFAVLLNGLAFGQGISGKNRVDEVRQALYKALEQTQNQLARDKDSDFFRGKTIGILPIEVYDRELPAELSGLLYDKLANVVRNAKLDCVSGKDDPKFQELMKEFAFNEKKTGILDEKTVQKMGKVLSVQVIMGMKVVNIDTDEPDGVFVEIELYAHDVETGRRIWGRNSIASYFAPQKPSGRVVIPKALKAAIDKSLESAAADLMSNRDNIMGKLEGTGENRVIALIPFTDDDANYVTDMVQTKLVKAGFQPRIPDVPNVRLAVKAIRYKALHTDGLCYGALRDFTEGACVEKPDRVNRNIVSTKTSSVEVMLNIADTQGKIIWSDMFKCEVPVVIDTRPMTNEELEKYDLDIKGDFIRWIQTNWKAILMWAGIVVGGLVVLCILVSLLKCILKIILIR